MCQLVSAWESMEETLAELDVRRCAARAVGAREGADGVGVLQKRNDVANGPRPPRGSIVKGRMAIWAKHS